jgi:hypothetical protein
MVSLADLPASPDFLLVGGANAIERGDYKLGLRAKTYALWLWCSTSGA